MSRLWGGKKAKPKGDKCSFCQQIIAKDKTHSGMFYSVAASDDDEGGTIHSVRRAPLLSSVRRLVLLDFYESQTRESPHIAIHCRCRLSIDYDYSYVYQV